MRKYWGSILGKCINHVLERLARLHVKDPSLTAQSVSQAKFRKKVESFGMIKDATKIVKHRGRKRNPHGPSNPFSPRLVVYHSLVGHSPGQDEFQLRGSCSIK